MPELFVESEIRSQPDAWSRAHEAASAHGGALPQRGERVAFVGCGTSWFMAMAAAAFREDAGLGESDAFAASEVSARRSYDRIVAFSRSGTTTEVVRLLAVADAPTTLITAVAASPAEHHATSTIVLPYADEYSVVQTRFATTALALLRSHLGDDLAVAVADARAALAIDVASLAPALQATFVGTRWAVGLAHEAALKAREAAQLWTESYPAFEYRHGPVAIAEEGRLVWGLDRESAGLRREVEATGARYVHHSLDPMAELVVAQRFAVAAAVRRGLNPDRPRSLTRSVILDGN